jgi:glutathione S-transferase
MRGDYLLADHPSVADFYLFVMLLWAQRFGVAIPEEIVALGDRLSRRSAVREAMRVEGLL